MAIDQSLVLEPGQEALPFGDLVDRFIIFVIFSGIAVSVAGGITQGFADPLLDLVNRHHWSTLLARPGLLWLTAGSVLLAVRTVLWLNYRPFASATEADAPRLTVIIPAYNEGPMVAKTVESVVAARYPRDRLQVIIIDDGSRDDTWQHIEAAAARFPDCVQAVRFAKNQGKRAALAEGFRRGNGEVFVTIDSDSMIESGALLAMVGPFRDPRIGAVGGKVAVFNRYQGLLPRMLHVRFALSFDFLRSVQSTYRTLYCCPGALSAYRREAVVRALPRWENQTFLGARCTFGEDRAMTNEILDQGLDAVYQRTAVVHTIVPHTYNKLCRMYLRWDRSYVREELRLARILWKRPLVPLLLTLLEKTLTNLRFPIAYFSMGTLAVLAFQEPMLIVRVLGSIGLASTFYMLYYLRYDRSWEFVYGIAYAFFSLFTLLWIFPWAVVTVRSRSWMTR